MDPLTVPLPGPLGGNPPFAFVGRRRELELLTAAQPRPDRGLQVVVVAGEPGAGKSRLVREVARQTVDDGHVVLYGSSDPSAAVSYQAISESLDLLLRHLPDDHLHDAVGPHGGELLRLFPDLIRRLEGGVAAPVPAAPETEQHRLHSALADLLVNVSQRTPVVLVLEDLHWADRSTLLLLRHLLRTAREARLCLVLTFRDAEADVHPPLAELLADLARRDGVQRLKVGGLQPQDISELVEELGGVQDAEAHKELVAALAELTAGNAFLLGELWRQLVETGALEQSNGRWRVTASVRDQSSPDRVRDVVAERLARLAPTTRSLLEVAAAVGPEADLRLLRRALDADENAILTGLEEAVRSGTLEPTAGPRPAYRFAHQLVRRAVYDRLNPVARARIHLRVAEALEQLPAEGPRTLRDLATHYTAAAELGPIETAVKYCLRAAEAAFRQLAFDETADRLATALALGLPVEDRGPAHLRRGAALRAAGAWRDAVDSYEHAAAWARETGDPQALAAAALGLEETCWRPAITDAGAAALLTEAIAALGPAETALRVRLLAALARAHGYSGEAAPAAAARVAAVDLARRLDDRHALAVALAQSYWGRGNDPVDATIDAMAQAHQLAEELGDHELAHSVMAWWLPALGEAGRLNELREMLAASRSAAENLGQQVFRYHVTQSSAALALADGKLDEAEQHAAEALEYSRLGGLDASGAHGIQMFGIRREQGRLSELAPVLQLLADQPDVTSIWRPGLALLFAELDMQDEARREIARLCADGFAEVPDDSLKTAALAYLAEACAMLDDRAHAALVYEQLLPWAGRPLMVAGMVAFFGSADGRLGHLASLAERWDVAERHFAAGLALNEHMGVVTPQAWTRYAFGKMLLDRGRPTDADRAAALLDAAGRAAVRHGLASLSQRLAELRPGPEPPIELPMGLTEREVDVLRVVAEGLSNREIGSRLFISPNTAANHVRNILMKTGCANRTEAATFAHQHGLMPDRPRTRT